MNFLAHAYLSGNKDLILFGNFVADAVKGNGFLRFPDDIQTGIRLHRKIDSYTDSHPIFKRSLGRVRKDFRKYSGIVIDIYYDHFLARNWKEYSDTELPEFAEHVYQVLQSNHEHLPGRTKQMLPFLVMQNWLVGYATFPELSGVFHGMDRRTSLHSGMSNAVEVLEKNYGGLKSDFEAYFPELITYAKEELNSLLNDRV